MKKSLLALALVASSANAEVVTVTGFGDTYENALKSCQMTAAARVTGTWVNAERNLRDDVYNEDITTYHGAVINSTSVKTYRNEEMVCVVDVDPVKDNTVVTYSATVPNLKKHNEEFKQFEKALATVDNRTRALKVVVNDITYKPMGEYTNVYIDLSVVWDPKWISDTKRLFEKRGEKGEGTYDLNNQLLGSVVNVFANSGNPVMAAVVGDMMYETHQKRTDHVVCFGGSKKSIADDCWESVKPLQSFQYPSFSIVVDAGEGRKEWFTHRIEVKDLYERIYPNKTKQHQMFKSVKMTYMNPGIAVYTKEKQRVQFGFSVSSDELDKVEKLKFVIKE